jgi:hypothetical protein
LSGNVPIVQIDSITGFNYRLQTGTSLRTEDFTAAGSAQQGSTGATLTFTGPAASAQRGFYRILIEPAGY